jgi:hypothetical protein
MPKSKTQSSWKEMNEAFKREMVKHGLEAKQVGNSSRFVVEFPTEITWGNVVKQAREAVEAASQAKELSAKQRMAVDAFHYAFMKLLKQAVKDYVPPPFDTFKDRTNCVISRCQTTPNLMSILIYG